MVSPLGERVSLHRKVNNILVTTLILVGIYMCIFPFLPQLSWSWHHRHNPGPSSSITSLAYESTGESSAPISKDNLLIIPRLEMREHINTGNSITELNKGAWLVPNTSSPSQKSNTVIVGHRFTYAGAAVFYFLDKLQVGDQVVVTWNEKEYTYKVHDIKIVSPTELDVHKASEQPILTLYTCTPLWSAKNRLVVTALLEGVR